MGAERYTVQLPGGPEVIEIEAMAVPTCLDCRYVKLSPTGKVIHCTLLMGEHPLAHMDQPAAMEDATGCRLFMAKETGRCSNFPCDLGIVAPRYSWSLWVTGPSETVPVCSDPCRIELQKKVDQAAKKLQEDHPQPGADA